MANERILVVDSSAETREQLAATILSPEGYDVLTAASGEEGFVVARDLLPDLILVEQVMPGMSGLEMLAALHDAGVNSPVILMTAQGSEALAVQAMRAGVRDYLIKPLSQDVALESVRNVLRKHWARQIRDRISERLLQSNRQLEQRFRDLTALVNIGTGVTAMLDIQQVLNLVAEAAVSVTGAEVASLFLVDRQTGELYMRAARNLDQKTVSTLRFKVNDSVIGQVLADGQPLVLDEEDVVRARLVFPVKSAVYVPLRAKGDVIGILSADNRLEPRSFDQQDVQLLSILADFAAVAIENARLYAETSLERDTLDAIMRDTDDYVIVIDAHERVLFCNPTAREAFSVTRTDFVGRPLNEVIRNPEIVTLFEKDALVGRSRRSEITLNRNGSERTLNAQLTIIGGIGRALVMQDITLLKQIDKAKSDFVATVAHDLRSPLTAILGYTELLQRAGPMNEQQDKFVEQITSSVQSITVLITELLELSRIEAGFNIDLEPVSLPAITQQSLRDLNHHLNVKQHRLEWIAAPELPFVNGNPLRLRQMISNLVGNAIKYTPDSGQIAITMWSEQDLVFWRISDSGIGIPAEDQPYVFDKFYRTERAVNEYDGTGLGLSIVRSIVEQHHGRIWLESRENEGTIFTVVLPRGDDAPPASSYDTPQ
ncbi:MAG: response regulator [Anaerolineae bacterium]|nr:response regulator [Anaerolineae bacterium]